MAKVGRPEGYRVPSLYKHFKGKQPTLCSLLSKLHVGKRELVRMMKARPDVAWRMFDNPMGSMKFKHLVYLSFILDKTPGEIADIIYKDLDKSNMNIHKKDIAKARDEAQKNREMNAENQKEIKKGPKQKGWEYDI